MATHTERSAAVAALARRLGETDQAPKAQIWRIVGRVGIEAAEAWAAEAERIEAAGGEMLPDGSRRRTLGGVFFRVARQNMSVKDRGFVFGMGQRPQANKGKTPAASAPAAPVVAQLSWEDRDEWTLEALKERGRATTVKITVIGRPTKAVDRQGFVLLVLEHEGKLANLPKGIPVPGAPLPTSYICYIGGKQWNKVKEALRNPEDVLIAEGVPVLDPKYAAVTVFVTNATTKLLQQAAKAAQQAKAE